MEIREQKAITITMSMEEAYKLERELYAMPYEEEEYPLSHKLYILLPEMEV